jgi:3-phytase
MESKETEMTTQYEKKRHSSSLCKVIIAILSATVIGLLGYILFTNSEDDESKVTSSITSFVECVASGNPVAESYPRKCTDGNGVSYTEELSQDQIREQIKHLPNPKALVETESMSRGEGDVADDMAIWYDPGDPSKSVIIADNKASDGGIVVFDLDGSIVQDIELGSIGNVDIRTDVKFDGSNRTIVAATDRTNKQLLLFEFDEGVRRLIEEPLLSEPLDYEPYGVCMYRSANNLSQVFVTDRDSGLLEQFNLSDDSRKVKKIERDFNISSLSEGCVADDELGYLYVAEEDVGLWKFHINLEENSEKIMVDTEENGGNTGFDLEGVSLSYGPDGGGYIFLSRQGDSEVAIYEREGDNAFIKTFSIEGSGGIDSPTETDGLDVVAADFGGPFTSGLLVVHDAENSGGTTSNLKFAALEDVIGHF